MAEAVKGRRSYDSSRRKEQALETQRAILAAAHDLFVQRGYGRTTIAEVAREAGVSPETIYATFGNKVTLLRRVWDVTIGGDDEDVLFHERPEIQALVAEADLAKRMQMQARFFTTTARRISPLLRALEGASGSEPAAAEMLAEIGRQRLVGLSVMARAAAATKQLAVTEEQCRDFVWSVTDGMLWHRLVLERGWTDDEFAVWLGRMFVQMLVRGESAG